MVEGEPIEQQFRERMVSACKVFKVWLWWWTCVVCLQFGLVNHQIWKELPTQTKSYDACMINNSLLLRTYNVVLMKVLFSVLCSLDIVKRVKPMDWYNWMMVCSKALHCCWSCCILIHTQHNNLSQMQQY